MKPKFDGYAAQYDAWFMENDNLFQSELRLFQRALGDISDQRVLSVGCGSGLVESMIDCSGIEGIEPSRDMGAIAEKRGVNVVAVEPGRIRVAEADCPDEVCVHTGWIDGPATPIACVPHGLTVTVAREGGDGDGLDAVAR